MQNKQCQVSIMEQPTREKPNTLLGTNVFNLQNWGVGQFASNVKSLILRIFPEPQWIGEVGDAKHVDDLTISASIIWKSMLDFENLFLIPRLQADSGKSEQGISKRNSHSRRKSSFREAIISGQTHIVWRIYDFFKMSRANEAMLDLRCLSNVPVNSDRVRVFDTEWDEVMSAVIDNILESQCRMQI